MFTLGTQYYRAPFPDSKYWDTDMAQMADAGINTVQLWVVWGWVEAVPGEFRYDDYDELVATADKHGLKVMLSTIAAIHPYWIHREVPDSEMVDNFGNKVISSNRGECHFGLTPGGCTDHPEIWQRMQAFLAATATRYRSASNLFGWDAWNELRWNVCSDGLVCFCPHTLAAFRDWLKGKYGDLDTLNASWHRRYGSWEDVRPGKMPRSPYTEVMAFEHFISCRSNELARARVDVIKGLDPDHPVTVHGGCPSIMHGDDYPVGTSLHKGNDWAMADHIEGIGTSSFPHWYGEDLVEYGSRIDFTASAAAVKQRKIWLSEVQGGRAAQGLCQHTPVPAGDQQRWIWLGISRGAEAILFWCWRDEVFGSESGGFGLAGNDGHADERLDAMRTTSRLLQEHEEVLEKYRPAAPEAGILFSPQSYYMHWAEETNGRTPQHALQGVARALSKHNMPYITVEEEHLDDAILAGLKIIFMPRITVLDDGPAERLAQFVRDGGTIVCDSECAAFGSNGLYRYPEDRFTTALTGVQEAGRRTFEGLSLDLTIDGETVTVPAKQWLTPLDMDPDKVSVCYAMHDGQPLVAEVVAGEGHVVFCGSYFADAYYRSERGSEEQYAPYAAGFERFIGALAVRAGVRPVADVLTGNGPESEHVLVKTGAAGDRRLAFVTGDKGSTVSLRFPVDFFKADTIQDLISGADVSCERGADGQECRIPLGDWGLAVLSG